MVKLGIRRAFFQHIIFALPKRVVTDEQILIKINMIQNSRNTLKQRMFLEKGNGGGAVFVSILNLASWNMLIHAAGNLNGKATDVDYEKVVSCRMRS